MCNMKKVLQIFSPGRTANMQKLFTLKNPADLTTEYADVLRELEELCACFGKNYLRRFLNRIYGCITEVAGQRGVPHT